MTFDEALKKMPPCLEPNLDPLRHTSLKELLSMVEFELSLYEEGEPETDIRNGRQAAAVRSYISGLTEAIEA